MKIICTSKRKKLNMVDPGKLFKVVKELIFQLIENLQRLLWNYLIQIVSINKHFQGTFQMYILNVHFLFTIVKCPNVKKEITFKTYITNVH